MVFVVVGGNVPTQRDRFLASAPNQKAFGALADEMVSQFVVRNGQVLTDDFAPIDRLMGRND